MIKNKKKKPVYNPKTRYNPDPGGLMQALEELDYLAALDNDGNLSEMGIIMSEFPLEPQMAKTLLASCEFDCVSEVVIIAAMLTGNMCSADIWTSNQISVSINLHTCTNPCVVSYQVNRKLLMSHLSRGFFSADLLHRSLCGAEARGDPVPHEVPAPGGGPLHPHQYLQGL